uniref:Undecaprenyl-phosphate galactosephosphotransferase n=1 Tax=uncultured Armatimonadetes bacterium TaxID=157466 RepID=A0A6J4JY42_9BACT|nr:Undecaprenyl-phosphate galactosephosphotransferase [uncultured Armatimonadetes bacterium]
MNRMARVAPGSRDGRVATKAAGRQTRREGNGDLAKRAFDVAVAGPLLAAAAPLMLGIALAVRLESPGPALFRQERVGRDGRRFVLWKFRTMWAGTPTLPTDAMSGLPSPVTRVGKWLRRTSLDELPQLVNVLKGEMSLVGPRPALPMQAELNAKRSACGVDGLLPGITGWAQINGRDDLDTDAKVAHDAWYLRHRSLALDLTILVRTLAPVASGRGNR